MLDFAGALLTLLFYAAWAAVCFIGSVVIWYYVLGPILR